jgi:hypothetical protein
MRPGSDDDVLVGKGDWLFERDGGRRVLAQMRGDLLLALKAARTLSPAVVAGTVSA